MTRSPHGASSSAGPSCPGMPSFNRKTIPMSEYEKLIAELRERADVENISHGEFDLLTRAATALEGVAREAERRWHEEDGALQDTTRALIAAEARAERAEAALKPGGNPDAVVLLQARYVLRDLHRKDAKCGYGKMADACERSALSAIVGEEISSCTDLSAHVAGATATDTQHSAGKED